MTEDYNVPVYNSADEIPIYEKQQVKPINYDGLPQFNIIKVFADYIAGIKDSYPEYSLQNGLGILSATVRRRLYIRMNNEYIYSNLWTLSLGPSGYSRKSGALGSAKGIISNAIDHTFLPEDTTPEGLIEAMASRVLIPKTDQDGNNAMESVERDIEGKIPFSQKAYWKDEAGQMYAGMNKAHMQGMGELFCVLHGCPSEYYKKLVSKSIVIEDAYFTMNLTTTPTSFMKHAMAHDVGTGFIPRHLIVNPSYVKPRKPLKEDSDRDNENEQIITKAIKIIDNVLPDEAIKMRFQDGALDIINDWAEEREEYFARTKNESTGSFFAKYQMNVVRVAGLIELGNIPYYLAMNIKDAEEIHINDKYKDDGSDYLELIKNMPDDIDYRLTELNISLASTQIALKFMDSVWLPYAANLEFNDGQSSIHNDVEKFYALMEKEKKITHSKLVKKFNKNRLDEILHVAWEEGHIEFCQVKTKTKPQNYVVYKPTDTTNFYFENDYSNVKIEEFKPNMKFKKHSKVDVSQPVW